MIVAHHNAAADKARSSRTTRGMPIAAAYQLQVETPRIKLAGEASDNCPAVLRRHAINGPTPIRYQGRARAVR